MKLLGYLLISPFVHLVITILLAKALKLNASNEEDMRTIRGVGCVVVLALLGLLILGGII